MQSRDGYKFEFKLGFAVGCRSVRLRDCTAVLQAWVHVHYNAPALLAMALQCMPLYVFAVMFKVCC